MPIPSVENAIAACQSQTRSLFFEEPRFLRRNTSKQLH